MTRSFDTIPDEADRSADYSKPTAPVMSVCPFCGAISEKSETACPRCKMENSAINRQATRARIGPWYVMQSRNPSAPGMKCSTLLALIRKGQITPRSVIRGPTTFQLWRFAARVKGISREFGLCYSCSAELQRTSTFCPRCSRSQELPPNPDVLLENESPASKTVYREVNPRPEVPPASVRAEAPALSAEIESDAVQTTRSPTQIPSAAETMAELAEIPSPHNAPAALQSRPKQRPQEGVLTPRELAAAFSLQYDPTMDASRGSRSSGRGKSFLLVAILLLAVGGGASTFYFVPSLRQRFIAWVQDSSPAPAMTDNSSSTKRPVPDRTPDWMMTVPDTTPVTTPAKLSNSSSATASGTANSPEAPAATKPPAESNNSQPVSNNPPAQSSQQNSQPQNSQSQNSQPQNPQPAQPQLSQATPVVQAPAPAPIIDAPVVTSTPVDPRTSEAMDNATKLRESAGGDFDSLAMKLRSNGLDAEHRQDFAAAQYYYQQVESLPHDHWPSDIDRLLKNAARRAGDSR